MTWLLWLLAILMLAQGLFLAITPQRAVRYTLWKTRLVGARVAGPGTGTIAFYRIVGVAQVAVSLFLLFKLLSE